MERIIFHVDMDAFFASVEQLDHPEYRGKPVIVGAQPGSRGVVSAASYEARKFGVHSAMPISEAFRRCPKGVFVPVRGERYSEVSRQILAVFRSFSPQVQQVSIDEAFLDMSGCCHLHGGKMQSAQALKTRILNGTGLTASVGVAPSRMVAKIASDLQKPNGLTLIEPGQVLGFLAPLPVRKIWGIGPRTEENLAKLGIHKIEQLRAFPIEVLNARFGNAGQWFYDLANGMDESAIEPDEGVKSISHETTFEHDTTDPELVRRTLLELSELVGWRARKSGLRGRTVAFTFRDSSFRRFNRTRTMPCGVDQDMEIFAIVEGLWKKEGLSGRLLRLIGVGLENFSTEAEPLDLFEDPNDERRRKAQTTMDEIVRKWGRNAISHGAGLEAPDDTSGSAPR